MPTDREDDAGDKGYLGMGTRAGSYINIFIMMFVIMSWNYFLSLVAHCSSKIRRFLKLDEIER